MEADGGRRTVGAELDEDIRRPCVARELVCHGERTRGLNGRPQSDFVETILGRNMDAGVFSRRQVITEYRSQ